MDTLQEIINKATFGDVGARAPRIDEFVNIFEPVPNGASGIRRGLDMHLARVVAIVPEGFTVEVWDRHTQRFAAKFLAPACCIVGRCAISEYSLTGRA